ncbi:MAG: hypothetical protein LBR44_04660 [Clostridiales Family XIII bacterium]|jgi:hypothetical protein|nr:hypothetical protein [Clostridiales Family XIII bacterium]
MKTDETLVHSEAPEDGREGVDQRLPNGGIAKAAKKSGKRLRKGVGKAFYKLDKLEVGYNKICDAFGKLRFETHRAVVLWLLVAILFVAVVLLMEPIGSMAMDLPSNANLERGMMIALFAMGGLFYIAAKSFDARERGEGEKVQALFHDFLRRRDGTAWEGDIRIYYSILKEESDFRIPGLTNMIEQYYKEADAGKRAWPSFELRTGLYAVWEKERAEAAAAVTRKQNQASLSAPTGNGIGLFAGIVGVASLVSLAIAIMSLVSPGWLEEIIGKLAST